MNKAVRYAIPDQPASAWSDADRDELRAELDKMVDVDMVRDREYAERLATLLAISGLSHDRWTIKAFFLGALVAECARSEGARDGHREENRCGN